jgi:hypothetical protein
MAELNIPTLRGDVRDALLEHVKSLPKPWPQMSELEQDAAIARAETLADKLVRQAVALAASRGFEHYEVSLGKYAIDKAIEGKFSAPYSTDLVEALGTRRGATFLLVPRDLSDFQGARAAAVASPDQPSLLDDEFDGEPEDDDDDDLALEDDDEADDPEPDEDDTPAAPLGRSPDFEDVREAAGLK